MRVSERPPSSSITRTAQPGERGGICDLVILLGGVLASCRPRRPYEIPPRVVQTMNVAPRPPPSLRASTEPSCISTRLLTMESPSPRPPWRRVVEASACRKRSNTNGRKLGSMPCPLSLTLISAACRTLHVALNLARAKTVTKPPVGRVNLMAFVSRFQNTCCSRPGSPLTGRVGLAAMCSRTLFASAAGRTPATAASSTPARSVLLQLHCQLPRENPTHIEQILHHARLEFGVALDDFDTL